MAELDKELHDPSFQEVVIQHEVSSNMLVLAEGHESKSFCLSIARNPVRTVESIIERIGIERNPPHETSAACRHSNDATLQKLNEQDVRLFGKQR
jgi:hypothetical protein